MSPNIFQMSSGYFHLFFNKQPIFTFVERGGIIFHMGLSIFPHGDLCNSAVHIRLLASCHYPKLLFALYIWFLFGKYRNLKFFCYSNLKIFIWFIPLFLCLESFIYLHFLQILLLNIRTFIERWLYDWYIFC